MAQGAIAGWSSFLASKVFSKIPASGQLITYTAEVLLGNSLAEAQTQTVDVVINDKGEVSIAGSAFTVFSQTALGVAVATGAFGLAGFVGAITLFGGLVVSAGIAVGWAVLGGCVCKRNDVYNKLWLESRLCFG